MKEQVLSTEQMQELIELGIDTSNASMVWVMNNSKLSDWKSTLETNEDIESWTSLGLNAIPTFTLQDIFNMFSYYTLKRHGIYIELSVLLNQWEEHVVCESSEMQAAFEMLKWYKQNNYI